MGYFGLKMDQLGPLNGSGSFQKYLYHNKLEKFVKRTYYHPVRKVSLGDLPSSTTSWKSLLRGPTIIHF
jgi:hypothetical protein